MEFRIQGIYSLEIMEIKIKSLHHRGTEKHREKRKDSLEIMGIMDIKANMWL